MNTPSITRLVLCLLLASLSIPLSFGQAQESQIARQIRGVEKVFKTTQATTPLSFLTSVTTQSKAMDQVVTEGSYYTLDQEALDRLFLSPPDLLVVTVQTGKNISLILQLRKAQIFTESFNVFAASDRTTPYPYHEGLYYWGVVADTPSSLVALSFTHDEVMGFIQIGGDNYTLGKIDGDADGLHILYRTDDLLADPGVRCYTDSSYQIGTQPIDISSHRQLSTNCVRMYIEVDHDIYVQKGGMQQAADYVNGAFSQVAILYANEQIDFTVNELVVWNVSDPYNGPTTSNYLTQFRNNLNGNYNGDLAHLVGYNGGGGVAYLDVLCDYYYGVGYSGINSSYQNVPTYNWTVEVLTHEIGHNLGSPHTHACAWNGNNTAIDGCGPAAGYSEGCNAPLPAAGTIMSYCHLIGGVGIDFNLGFGPQPGNLIRNRVNTSTCLTSCGPPVMDDAGIVDITAPIPYPCQSTTSPEVVLQNFGSNTLTSVTINYQLDAGAVQTYAWTGSLGQNQTSSVSLPDISYGTGSHTFDAYTTNPNNTADENSANDGSAVSFTYYVDWCVCNDATASILPNPLTHSGIGSSSAGVSFAPGSKHPAFTITNLDAKQNGPPQNRYNEVVDVTYTDGEGQLQNYGTFYGSQQSTVSVSIFGFVNSITISLSNGQGNQYNGTLSVSFSPVDYCAPGGAGCPDADGDGFCDDNGDLCLGFDDNLIGTACDDGDACTENDIYITTPTCHCEGTPIPDCPGEGCTSPLTSNLTPNPLTHTGLGESISIVSFPANNFDVTFTISNIDARLNGNPSKRYIDEVTVTYVDGSDNTLPVGVYRGDQVSSQDISISGEVKSVTVALADAYDGDTGSETIDISMSTISSCIASALSEGESDDHNGSIVQIYPNPTSEELFVKLNKAPESGTVKLYNTLGLCLGTVKITDLNTSLIRLSDYGIWDSQILFVAVEADGVDLGIQAVTVIR